MPRLVLLPVVALVLGCGSTNIRGELFPPPQSRPAEAPLYVQARQYGTSVPLWRLGDVSDGFGLTLDAYNRSRSAVTLQLGQATKAWQPRSGARRVNARVSASGSGELPSTVPSSHDQPLEVTLQPGQQATLWVMFDELDQDEIAPSDAWNREIVALPISTGEELILQLTDPADAPVFLPHGAKIGLSLMAGARSFGGPSHSLDLNAVPYVIGWWYRRAAVKATLFGGGSEVIETVDDVTVKERAGWLSLDIAWVPFRSHVGAYAASSMILGKLERTSWSRDGSRFAGEVGLIVAPTKVRGIPIAIRFGYNRVFQVAAARNGFVAALELPIMWF